TICCWQTGSRTKLIVALCTVVNLTVNTNGYVTVQLVSGPMPTSYFGFHGTFNLYTNTYYSAAASGNFTRNNCPAGQTGSSVPYSIAAYSYTSIISQADADAQAQAALASGGQTNANNTGTCNAPCTFTRQSGINFYTSTISSNGTTGNFNFVLVSPSSSWWGGTIGSIDPGC